MFKGALKLIHPNIYDVINSYKNAAVQMKRVFRKDISGNVAMITALVLPLLIALSVGAVDYSRAVHQKQELKAAADAAVLAGVNEAYIAYVNGESVDYVAVMEQAAQGAFAARAAKLNLSDPPSFTPSGSIENNVFSLEANFDSVYSGNVSHMGNVSIGGGSKARASTAAYININLIFDVSHSMAIGASASDQQWMSDNIRCAFACHIGGSNNSSYRRTQRANINMRVDVAREGAITAIDAVNENLSLEDQVTYSVHTFDNLVQDVVPVNHSRANDVEYVKSQIRTGVDLTAWHGGTNIEHAIETIAARLPANGTGRTPESRIQYIVVLTDGVESTQARYQTGGWRQHHEANLNSPYKRHAHHEVNYALDPDVCRPLRDQNIPIYFIHTEYDDPSSFRAQSSHNTRRWGFIRDTLHDLIPMRFANCTGDADRVLEARTPAEITNTFTEVLTGIASPLRLE